MRDYFAHQPRQLSLASARRHFPQHSTLPANLQTIKQNLLNRTTTKGTNK